MYVAHGFERENKYCTEILITEKLQMLHDIKRLSAVKSAFEI